MSYRIETPLEDELVPQLWAMMEPFEHEMLDDVAPHSEEEVRAANQKSKERGFPFYAVLDGERLLGAVWADLIDGKAFGHLVFLPHTITPTEKMTATRECLRRMAAEHGIAAINWAFYIDNRAFHVFLRRLGARELSIFRKDTVRHGEAVDVRLMVSEAAE